MGWPSSGLHKVAAPHRPRLHSPACAPCSLLSRELQSQRRTERWRGSSQCVFAHGSDERATATAGGAWKGGTLDSVDAGLATMYACRYSSRGIHAATP